MGTFSEVKISIRFRRSRKWKRFWTSNNGYIFGVSNNECVFGGTVA